MKEGWIYKKLGEVCDFEGGSQPPKSEWINHPQDGYIRMLQIRDFTKSRNAEIEYVKNTKKLRFCKADDILIGRYGASVGKILTGLAGAYNVAIIKSIPNEELISKDFIRRYFESSLFQSILFKVCTSRAAQAGFSKDDIKDELIPIPPLSEQQSIVDYLDSAFAKIDAMKANAEKALNEAKALFQASLKEMLEPKDGWKEDTLINVFNFIDYRGATPKKLQSGIPLVTAKNLKYGYIDYSIKDYISKEEYETRKGRGISRKGDLLFTTEAPLGNVAIANLEEYSAGQRLITLQQYDNPKYEFINEFYYYYMLSSPFQNRIKELATGATAQGIKAKLLKTIIVPIPTLSEQQSIVATLDSLKSKVDRLQENFDKISQECDALKQAILRQVFE